MSDALTCIVKGPCGNVAVSMAAVSSAVLPVKVVVIPDLLTYPAEVPEIAG
jgi:hypothetical protein